MLATLAVLAIGYRYWSAFLAAKALALSDAPPLDPRHLPSDREAARQGVHGMARRRADGGSDAVRPPDRRCVGSRSSGSLPCRMPRWAAAGERAAEHARRLLL